MGIDGILARILTKFQNDAYLSTLSDLLIEAIKGAFHWKIKAYLLRQVLLAPTIIERFTQPWLQIITDFLQMPDVYQTSPNESGIPRENLNTLVRDLCNIIWTTCKLDTSLIQPDNINHVIRMLFQYSHSKVKYIINSNIKTVAPIVELFRDMIESPSEVLLQYFSSGQGEQSQHLTVAYIISILAKNDIPIISSSFKLPIDDFICRMVKMLRSPHKDVYEAIAEVLGALLESEKEHDIHLKIKSALKVEIDRISPTNFSGQPDPEKFIMVIHHLSSTNPALVLDYYKALLYILPSVFGATRAKCLEIFVPKAAEIPDLLIELKSKDLVGIIQRKDDACQIAIILLLLGLVPKLNLSDTEYFLAHVMEVGSNHTNVLVRQVFFSFAAKLIEKCETESWPILDAVRKVFLTGLADPEYSIRSKMIEYYENKLADVRDVGARCQLALNELYSVDTEHLYLQYASHFVIDSSKYSPAYETPIFPAPLDNSQYESMEIDTGDHFGSTMLPMFSVDSRKARQPVSKLRATQDMVWTPTIQEASTLRSMFTSTALPYSESMQAEPLAAG